MMNNDENENSIKKFDGAPVLKKLIKPHSPLEIIFIPDVEDYYLIWVIRYKKKTGEIVKEIMIIEPDLETKLAFCRREGFN